MGFRIIVASVLVFAGVAPGCAAAAAMSYECPGCSSTQEEQLALNSPGQDIRFVHNPSAHRIRKFEVYIDYPNNRPVSKNASLRVVTTAPIKPTGNPTVDAAHAGGVRTLAEMDVDVAVQQIFGAVEQLDAVHSSLLTGVPVTIDISSAGLTSGDDGPRYFDPRQIAWDHPSGESARFMDRMNVLLNDPATANGVSPEVATLLHGIFKWIQSVYVEGGLHGPVVGINFQNIPNDAVLKMCDAQGNCAYMRLTSTATGVALTFEGTQDPTQTYFPNQNGPWPFYQNWQRGHSQDARNYADFVVRQLRGHFLDIQGYIDQCHVTLACVDVGERGRSCSLYCN